MGDQILDLASITKVWSISGSRKKLNGNSLGLLCCFKPLFLKFQVKDLSELFIAEILKVKCVFHWKSSGESWIGALQHLFHLVIVAQEEYTSILTWCTLNSSHNRVNYSSFVWICHISSSFPTRIQ